MKPATAAALCFGKVALFLQILRSEITTAVQSTTSWPHVMRPAESHRPTGNAAGWMKVLLLCVQHFRYPKVSSRFSRSPQVTFMVLSALLRPSQNPQVSSDLLRSQICEDFHTLHTSLFCSLCHFWSSSLWVFECLQKSFLFYVVAHINIYWSSWI